MGGVFGKFMGLFGWNNMLVREGGRLGKESSPGGGGVFPVRSRFVPVPFHRRAAPCLQAPCVNLHLKH